MKTLKTILPTFTIVLLAGCVTLYRVPPVSYDAYMKGTHEVPPVATSMIGDFTINSKGSFTLNVKKIEDATHRPTAAHIHCGKEGSNGPVVYTLISNPGVLGNTYSYSSSINEKKFTPNPKTEVCPIVIDSMESLTSAIEQGYVYVNVHTSSHPAGEIRGQVIKD